MASSMIHIAVASEINKIIKRDRKKLLIGTIAPDISKHIGKTKLESHFLDDVENDVPNLKRFLDKYKNNLNDDFVLGYYIHLYTDYIWFKYFVPDFFKNGYVYRLDGTKEYIPKEKIIKYIYNDYTNLNISLIDEYDLQLDIFYEELPVFDDVIKEIPMDKIQIIVDQAGLIIENSKEIKPYVFDMNIINNFIDKCKEYILSDLENFNIKF